MSKLTKTGIKIPSLKQPANQRPVVDIPLPSRLFVPLVAGDGGACQLIVNENETVQKRAVIAISGTANGFVYSPASGVLEGRQTVFHPLLGNVPCAVIKCANTIVDTRKKVPLASLGSEEIINIAYKKGIIDELDGQPLAKKLSACRKSNNLVLIADGSDSEPYSSSSWAVINQWGGLVYKGLKFAAIAAGTKNYKIGVMIDKNRFAGLLEKYRQIINPSVFIKADGKYPASYDLGSLKHLKKADTCRLGVQACLALYEALVFNHPQIDCVVTVAGDCVSNPRNVRAPFGTPVEHLLNFCGLSDPPEYVIIGDAMTGLAIQSPDIPIVPGITCLIAMKNRVQPPAHPCIGCGRCAAACHAKLLPYEIMRRLDNMQYERLDYLLPEECDGCGVCSYVCPSGLDVADKVLEARDSLGNIFMKWGVGDEL